MHSPKEKIWLKMHVSIQAPRFNSPSSIHQDPSTCCIRKREKFIVKLVGPVEPWSNVNSIVSNLTTYKLQAEMKIMERNWFINNCPTY